jgi:FdhD protein
MDHSKSSFKREMLEISEHKQTKITRNLAIEAPVALVYNGFSYAVMMVTPNDLENFIVGFSITEGIVASKDDIKDVDIVKVDAGIIARIEIEKYCFKNVQSRPRNLVGKSSCGLCGVEDLEAALPNLTPLKKPIKTSYSCIKSALKAMPLVQIENQLTGAMHAAGFISPNGDILELQEDIGRHSALDKLVGKIYKDGRDPQMGLLLLTSRCSYELVQKAIIAKFPLLVSVSAPTDLAVKLAIKNNLGLIALAREDTMLLLNDPWDSFGG